MSPANAVRENIAVAIAWIAAFMFRIVLLLALVQMMLAIALSSVVLVALTGRILLRLADFIQTPSVWP